MTEIAPITPTNQKLIVNNVLAACKDIAKLNKTGYGFLYLAYGFIAHYNLYGFIDHYKRDSSLKDKILHQQEYNQWANFRPGEQNYDYYVSKRDVYNKICEGLRK
jgi:hypothetical protein